MNLKNEVAQLQNEKTYLKGTVESLESMIDELNRTIRDKDDEIEKHEEARAELKQDLEEMNNNL